MEDGRRKEKQVIQSRSLHVVSVKISNAGSRPNRTALRQFHKDSLLKVRLPTQLKKPHKFEEGSGKERTIYNVLSLRGLCKV